MNRLTTVVLLIVTLDLMMLSSALAVPDYCAATHHVGAIELGVTNTGVTGVKFYPFTAIDCFTGLPVSGCIFPKGSTIEHLYEAALWVGAVVGYDTLVSVGFDGWQACREFNPNRAAPNQMIYRSLHGPDSLNAVSEEDFVSVYTDTIVSGANFCTDVIDFRPHRRLPIEVTEKSYAWSADEVSKVVFVELGIRNIGFTPLNEVYVGIYVDADVGSTLGRSWLDNISGLLRIDRDSNRCGIDTGQLLVPYVADNDGDLNGGIAAPSVIGLTFLKVPSGSVKFSYHWWESNANGSLDYGPRRKDNFRNFGTGGTGTPEGDRNKYFLMSSGEQDFDQIYTAAILPTDPIWEYPNQNVAAGLSDGNDARFLFSVGPFSISPSQSTSLVYAWVIGDSLHQDPGNYDNLVSNPNAYYANLHFADLIHTVRSANRFYDNPGVDTDSDGYKGSFVTCCAESVLVSPPSTYQCLLEDTVWTGGDGVPDYQIYAPPCCIGITGNVNLSESVDLSDLGALVSYLTGAGYVLPCAEEANVNNAGIVDLSDLSALVNYLTGFGFTLPNCP
jgi:hypothetical protein